MGEPTPARGRSVLAAALVKARCRHLAGRESRPDGSWGRVVVGRDAEAVEVLKAARLLKQAYTSEKPTPARGTARGT